MANDVAREIVNIAKNDVDRDAKNRQAVIEFIVPSTVQHPSRADHRVMPAYRSRVAFRFVPPHHTSVRVETKRTAPQPMSSHSQSLCTAPPPPSKSNHHPSRGGADTDTYIDKCQRDPSPNSPNDYGVALQLFIDRRDNDARMENVCRTALSIAMLNAGRVWTKDVLIAALDLPPDMPMNGVPPWAHCLVFASGMSQCALARDLRCMNPMAGNDDILRWAIAFAAAV